jgi:tetratricopeptide (TPR) repeat protein
MERGEFEAARTALDRYLEHANRLVELQPDNPEWLMEQSYALGNIAALINRQQSADVEAALERMEAALSINRRVIELAPENTGYISEYGEALAWQADTQMLLCDLGGALKTRQENVEIARRLMDGEPGNSALQRRYAYSLSGLANVATQIGLNAYALERLKGASDILTRIYAVDPSNLDIRWDQLRVEVLIALSRAETEGFPAALAMLEGLYEPLMMLVDQAVEQNVRQQQEWIDYLLKYAQLAWWAGDRALAAELRSQVAESLSGWIGSGNVGPEWQNEIILARFLHWEHAGDPASGVDGPTTSAAQEGSLPQARLDPGQPHMSCDKRSLLVLQALQDGETERARADTEFLLGKGYYEPGFVRICRHYDLCQGYG